MALKDPILTSYSLDFACEPCHARFATKAAKATHDAIFHGPELRKFGRKIRFGEVEDEAEKTSESGVVGCKGALI